MVPQRIEHSREQFVAEAGGDQRECVVEQGLLTRRDKLSLARTG